MIDRDEVTLRLIGIGGTGVVTIAQILGMAAVLDGRHTTGLSQTGLAQKGGPVVSDVRFVKDETQANRAVTGGVDGYLGFDLLGAANPINLQTASSSLTVAAISTSAVPTGSMIGDPEARFVDISEAIEQIERRTRADCNVFIDADELATLLFGDNQSSNTLLLGVAWQQGLIPLSLDALHEAFRLNGASVEANIAAFGWGRAVIADTDAVARATTRDLPAPEPIGAAVQTIIDGVNAEAESELERLLTIRVPELVAYQGRAYAARYADAVASVRVADAQAGGDGSATEAVARNLYTLMAYKDEYEVARLHLDPVERARLVAEFGPDAKIKYMLQPPFLRALGMDRKIALGRWFTPGFRLLKASRRLRGTAFDPFGRAEVRRIERALVPEYQELVARVLPHLGTEYRQVVEVLDAPTVIRGYEEVKLGNIASYRESVATQLDALESPKTAGSRAVSGSS